MGNLRLEDRVIYLEMRLKKVEDALSWLVSEVANTSNWLGKLNGECSTFEDREANTEAFWNHYRRYLPPHECQNADGETSGL